MIYSVESLYQDVKTPSASQSPAFVLFIQHRRGMIMRLYLTPSAVTCSMFNKKTLVLLQNLTSYINSQIWFLSITMLQFDLQMPIKVTHLVHFAVFVGGNNANIATGAWPGLPQLAGSSLAESIFKLHMSTRPQPRVRTLLLPTGYWWTTTVKMIEWPWFWTLPLSCGHSRPFSGNAVWYLRPTL